MALRSGTEVVPQMYGSHLGSDTPAPAGSACPVCRCWQNKLKSRESGGERAGIGC